MYNKLFSPGTIGKLKLKNRFVMSALHLGYSIEEEIPFYEERAKGGAGMIVTVAGVNKQGAVCNMPLIDEQYAKDLGRIVQAVGSYGSKLFVQLFHSGRNAYKGMLKDRDAEPVAPSQIPSPLYRYTPKEMSVQDIARTVSDFGKAAALCKKGGAHGVEISCSAGYLLTQFISPLTNKRTDSYGGSEKNRWRFPIEVISSVREAVGSEYPVSLRISGADMLGGYGIDDMCRFVSAIAPGMIDVISVTGGWHESHVPQIVSRVPAGGFAYLAGEIRRRVSVPVIACNRINDGDIAETILEGGYADFVGCARPFITDPAFANKIQKGIPYRKCIACNKGCIDRSFKLKRVCCVLNPESGFEGVSVPKADKPENILVIGGGVSGMETAKYAAIAGHRVTLCTKEHELGGLVNVAAKPPYKEDLSSLVAAMKYEIESLGVTIDYGTAADRQYIERVDPDKIYVATGSRPFVPGIEGVEESKHITAEDILGSDEETLNRIRNGKTVIIGGGAVGLETAHFLVEHSIFSKVGSETFLLKYAENDIKESLTEKLNITVVEMDGKAGRDLGGSKWIALKELDTAGVEIMTNTKVSAVRPDGVVVEKNGDEQFIPADTIVFATGYRPNSEEITRLLNEMGCKYKLVGDADTVGTIYENLKSAYESFMTEGEE